MKPVSTWRGIPIPPNVPNMCSQWRPSFRNLHISNHSAGNDMGIRGQVEMPPLFRETNKENIVTSKRRHQFCTGSRLRRNHCGALRECGRWTPSMSNLEDTISSLSNHKTKQGLKYKKHCEERTKSIYKTRQWLKCKKRKQMQSELIYFLNLLGGKLKFCQH